MRYDSRTTRTHAAAVGLLAAAVLAGCMPGAGGSTAQWNGAPFSGDLTDPRSPTKPSTRIYMGDGRLRLESTDPADHAALVLDPSHGTTLMILDKDRVYIDAGMFTPMVAAGFAPIMHFLRPVNGGDPCAEWNTSVDQFTALMHQRTSGQPPHFTCRDLGAESVNGRSARKWAVTSDHPAETSTIWIDDRLHIVSKSADAKGGMEMRNIHEGPQSAALFEAPPGYRKLGLSDMLASLGKSAGGASSSSSVGSASHPGGDTTAPASDAAAKAMQKLQEAIHR